MQHGQFHTYYFNMYGIIHQNEKYKVQKFHVLSCFFFISFAVTMFTPCNPGNDCLEDNSECRSGACACQLGYSYNPALYTCVTGKIGQNKSITIYVCTSYGY